jgi:hypothetical protein
MEMKLKLLLNFLPHRKFLYISAGVYFSSLLVSLQRKKAKCIASNIKSSLLEFDKNEVTKVKSSRVFLINNDSRKNENDAILDNLKKLYSRYPNLQSYFINSKDSKEVGDFVNYLKGTGSHNDSAIRAINNKENIENNPVIFVNKYGDVRAVNVNELEEVSKEESSFNFFEKFSILSNKNSILELNNHSFVFFIYLDSSKSNEENYSIPAFIAFRKIFFNLSFFNIKFFVSTTEFSEDLKDLRLNSSDINCLFLLKRIDHSNKSTEGTKRIVIINNEKFELIKLIEKQEKLGLEEDSKKILK